MYLISWAGEATNSQNAFRDEPSNAGGYSFDAYHWHFFGSRAQVPSGYVGFATAYFARKILHDPNGPDDRAKARLLADTAGDWWITKDARWDHFKTNWPMGFSRSKYLTNYWQMTTAFYDASPPPK